MTTPERLRRRQRIESTLVAILCVLLVASTLVIRADETEDDRALQLQADRNSAIVDCLTSYAADLTDALRDRDTVNKTATAAEKEWVSTFLRLVEDQTPPSDAREQFITASQRYKRIIDELQRTEAVNPYPEISECLNEAVTDAAMAYVLSAYSPTRRAVTCMGRPVTIRGGRGDDVITGTDGNDVIRTFRGKDIVSAGRGRDAICGGRGNDIINGGQQRDEARGNRGVDFCIQVEVARSC